MTEFGSHAEVSPQRELKGEGVGSRVPVTQFEDFVEYDDVARGGNVSESSVTQKTDADFSPTMTWGGRGGSVTQIESTGGFIDSPHVDATNKADAPLPRYARRGIQGYRFDGRGKLEAVHPIPKVQQRYDAAESKIGAGVDGINRGINAAQTVYRAAQKVGAFLDEVVGDTQKDERQPKK